MTPKRPLILHTRVVTGSGGGPDRTILNSPRFLQQAGYDSVCLFLRPPGDPGFDVLEERARDWAAPLRTIDDRGAWDLSVLTAAGKVCDELRPAVWHGHDYKSNVLGLLLARRHRYRLVTTVHGWVHRTWKTPLFYAIDRWSLRRYELVLCVSEGEYQACRRLGVPAERCRLLRNGVDTERFRPPHQGEGRLAPARSQRLRLGAIGRLSEEKGLDLLLRAVAELVGRGHDLELAVAGEGEARGSLFQLTAQLELADRVSFRGFVPEVERFHRELDVFVLSSRREGLPNALLEAMATETPAVATPLPGVVPIRDACADTVRFSDAVSAEALAAAIEPLLEDASARESSGRRARRCVVQEFSFAARMKKVAELYDELLSAGKRER